MDRLRSESLSESPLKYPPKSPLHAPTHPYTPLHTPTHTAPQQQIANYYDDTTFILPSPILKRDPGAPSGAQWAVSEEVLTAGAQALPASTGPPPIYAVHCVHHAGADRRGAVPGALRDRGGRLSGRRQ